MIFSHCRLYTPHPLLQLMLCYSINTQAMFNTFSAGFYFFSQWIYSYCVFSSKETKRRCHRTICGPSNWVKRKPCIFVASFDVAACNASLIHGFRGTAANPWDCSRDNTANSYSITFTCAVMKYQWLFDQAHNNITVMEIKTKYA